MGILILEGVTGAGKSSTIEALASIAVFVRVAEEVTFDSFMDDFSTDPSAASRRARDRLSAVLDTIEGAASSANYLLERFHFSHLALGSDWKWYQDIDMRCAALKCKVVALTIPNEQLATRSLYRAEYHDADWQHFIPRFGSEEQALRAIRAAQKSRIDAIEASRLERRLIDTHRKAWDNYAAEIVKWADWG